MEMIDLREAAVQRECRDDCGAPGDPLIAINFG